MKVTDAQFQAFVNDGIDSLPEWVHPKIQNVAFLISDEPSEDERAELGLGPDAVLFGLYQGVPLAERGIETPIEPDTITIYKQPILAAYETEDDIRACVANTIWHEVAHFFGHDEDWVEREELKRGKHL